MRQARPVRRGSDPKVTKRQPRQSSQPESPSTYGGVQKPTKPTKKESPSPNDFSSVVKSRLSTYTRTGQACDRCKVRKIRCDALPEGCSHCISQNQECYVTDRVTGRTERRGYMQQLEREKRDMMNHIKEMECMLRTSGLPVPEWSTSAGPLTVPSPQDSTGTASQASPASSDHWQQRSVRVRTSVATVLGQNAEPKRTNFHLGVGMDNAPLSSTNGFILNILGSTINIIDDDSEDLASATPGNPPVYNRSTQSCIQSMMGLQPAIRTEYPPRSEAFQYAEWYFLVVYPWHPILHKPTFMTMLTRLYDDPNFLPSAPESCMLHLVFASIYAQYEMRHSEAPEQRSHYNHLANSHLHSALSLLLPLFAEWTLEICQVYALMLSHVARFPKPRTSNLFGAYAMNLALELGLHRKKVVPGGGTNLENEIGKRLFWFIYSTTARLDGRMERPMHLRIEDIDADFPEPIADELLSAEGVDTTKSLRCPYEAGIALMKAGVLFQEMFSRIYSVRRNPQTYVADVEDLEEQMYAWLESLPPRLQVKGDAPTEDMFALHLHSSWLELRLSLRHPSVTNTNDPGLMATNTKICEETSKEMLTIATSLYKLRSLDSTWMALAVYVAAMFTTLVAHWERRHEVTTDEFERLRNDMGMWLLIVKEMVKNMDTNMDAVTSVSNIVDRTMSWIDHDRMQKSDNAMCQATRLTASDGSSAMEQLGPASIGQSDEHLTTSAYGPSNPSSPRRHSSSNNNNNNNNNTMQQYPEPMSEAAAYQSTLAYHHASSGPSMYGHGPGMMHPQVQPQIPRGVQPPMPSVLPTTSQHTQQPSSTHQQHHHQQQQQQQQRQQQQRQQQHDMYSENTTQMSPDEMMWREQFSCGSTWHDWTAAVLDSSADRYGADVLMSMGGGPGDHQQRPGMAPPPPPPPAPAPPSMGGESSFGVMDTTTAGGETSTPGQWPYVLYSSHGAEV